MRKPHHGLRGISRRRLPFTAAVAFVIGLSAAHGQGAAFRPLR